MTVQLLLSNGTRLTMPERYNLPHLGERVLRQWPRREARVIGYILTPAEPWTISPPTSKTNQ